MFRARMALLPKSPTARRRLTVVLAVAPVLTLAVALSLVAMRDAVVFFYGPSEAAARHLRPGQTVRIGGLVQPGSVAREGSGLVRFRIADQRSAVTAVYRGELPDLFREGQGVVAQGQFGPDGSFRATQVLAKHDERYMPKEVVESLKRSGEWRRGEGGGVPAMASTG
jgi:cytochrome c-type biogenesis protein CcmE